MSGTNSVTRFEAPSALKPSIFGNAKPRENVLKEKGLDWRKKEEEIEKKAASHKKYMPRLTSKQEEELKAIEAELNFAKNELSKNIDDTKAAALEAEVASKQTEIDRLVASFEKMSTESKPKGNSRFSRFAESNERSHRPERSGDFSSFSGHSSRPRGVCYDFQKGVCNRGESCRFAHEEGTEDNGSRGDFSSFNRGGSYGGRGGDRPRGVCYAFQRGDCDRGDSCRYSHEEGAGGDFSSFNGGRGGRDRACYNCGEAGHLSRECPSGGGGRSYGGGRACYNCGKEGHMSRECPE
jgi:hypothetical protein